MSWSLNLGCSIKFCEISYKFKEKNNRTYSVMTLEKDLSEIDKSLIKGQVDNSIYHIEIDNNEDGKNIIEIHLNNVINQELVLEKGKKE